MTVFCLGAVLVGLVAALLIPFLPFACALVVAVGLGFASLTVEGAALGRTTLSAAALLFASQVGYGLGLVLVALVSRRMEAVRHVAAQTQGVPPVHPLQTGGKPH